MNAAERGKVALLADRLSRVAHGREGTRGDLRLLMAETSDALLELLPREERARAKRCPVAARALKACSGIGTRVDELTAYLDTFGPAESPEREAQAARLSALPVYAQFAYEGMPAKLQKDAEAGRTFLGARMAQFEVDDDERRELARRTAEWELERRRREKVERERKTLRRWAMARRGPGYLIVSAAA